MCPLRLHHILPVMIAFEGDVVVVVAPAVDRDGWRRRLLVARSRHDRRERPNGPRVARACRSAASATSRSNGNAQESEQGVLAVEFCDDSRCKNSRLRRLPPGALRLAAWYSPSRDGRLSAQRAAHCVARVPAAWCACRRVCGPSPQVHLVLSSQNTRKAVGRVC